jgi:hypothetical protein
MPEASRLRKLRHRTRNGGNAAVAAAAIAAATLISSVPVGADPVADFYRGKTLRMLIGYGPGGGYDIYGRLVAEFLPRHLPGHPTIIAQNMPGAGSFVAAKYIYEIAPKDGTVLGSLAQTLALDSLTNTSAKLDVANMPYVGRVVTNIDTGVALPKSGIKSFDDVRAKPYTVGASGGGSTTVLFPTALNAYAGAKFKLVRGYSGTNDILLAMERGEVDIVGAYGLPGILVSHPGWVHRGAATFLSRLRSSGIPSCPMCRRSRSSPCRTKAARCCTQPPAPVKSAAPFSPHRACRRSGYVRCAPHFERCSRIRISSPRAKSAS